MTSWQLINYQTIILIVFQYPKARLVAFVLYDFFIADLEAPLLFFILSYFYWATCLILIRIAPIFSVDT